MNSIPKHMQINKTPGNRPSKELIKKLVNLVATKGENSGLSWDHYKTDSLYISVTWSGGWLAKRLRLWHCISVSSKGREEWHPDGTYRYLLCEYNDFTRAYEPGSWEEEVD